MVVVAEESNESKSENQNVSKDIVVDNEESRKVIEEITETKSAMDSSLVQEQNAENAIKTDDNLKPVVTIVNSKPKTILDQNIFDMLSVTNHTLLVGFGKNNFGRFSVSAIYNETTGQ